MNRNSRGRFIASSLAAVGGLAFPFARAMADTGNWPAKPLKLIVPYPTGGAVDIIGRLIGQKLSEALKQAVVIENMGGASGIIGTTAVAKAEPDGYTLLMSYVSTLSIHPSLYAKLSYDPQKDFAPIGEVCNTALVMVVPPSLGVQSLQEFVAYAKARPGQLNYASVGNGSGGHLAAELLKQVTGLNITQVSYKGSGPALTDLLGGHVQVMFDALPSSLPLVAAGKLRALAVTGAKRTSAAPDIPTVAESGFPGYDIAPWFGLLAPAGTPQAIVQRLNAELNKIISQPDVKAQFAKMGADPVSTTPEQFAAFIRTEAAKWDKVIKSANIKPE